MKNILKSMFLVLVLSLTQSCQERLIDTKFEPLDPILNFQGDDSFHVSKSGGEFTFSFESNLPWIIENKADWVSFDGEDRGLATDGFRDVVCSIAPNKSLNERTAVITIRITDEAQSFITITQAPMELSDLGNDIYVKVDGTGDGSSWENAINFAGALEKVLDGDVIHMAAGTYVPTVTIRGGANGNPADNTFELAANATIIGGYPADAKAGDQPDPKVNKVILSGNQSCYRVLVVCAPKDKTFTAKASGIVITNGDCTNSTDIRLNGGLLKKGLGAGLLVVGSNFTLSNSSVESNKGAFCPGMLNCDGANTLIENCIFDSNEANMNAGNIWNSAATLEIRNSIISNNKAVGGVGGGLLTMGYTALKDPTVTYVYNTLFDSNSSKSRGPGLFVRQGSHTVVANCTFTGNEGKSGAISVHGSGAKLCLISSTITKNAGQDEGVLYAYPDTELKMYNTILSGNTTTGSDEIILKSQEIKEAVSYSVIGSNVYGKEGSVSGAFDSEIMFLPFANNVYPLAPDASARTLGMPISELQLVVSGFTPELKSEYLTIDQNGKQRTANIMGASVD